MDVDVQVPRFIVRVEVLGDEVGNAAFFTDPAGGFIILLGVADPETSPGIAALLETASHAFGEAEYSQEIVDAGDGGDEEEKPPFPF